MKIIIYDCDFEALNIAEAACENIFPHSTISVFNNAASTTEEVLKLPPDIAIINIDDESGKGRVIAEKIYSLNKKANQIFISGDSELPAIAMRIYPSGYLNKPVTKEAIEEALRNLRHPVSA